MKRTRLSLAIRSFILVLLPVCIVLAEDVSLFEHANELLREQDYEGALKAYAAFTAENPAHRLVLAARWTMANIQLVVSEEYEKAADIYQNIINDNPETDWEMAAYDRLLICCRGMDDDEGVINIYKESLAKNPAVPSAPESQYNLAVAYLDKEETQEAAKNFAMVVDRYPVSNYARRVQDEHTKLLVDQCAYDWIPFTTFQSALGQSGAGEYEQALAGLDEVMEVKRNTGMDCAARFQKEYIGFRKSGDAAGFRAKLRSSEEDYPYGFGGVRADQLENILEVIIEAREAVAVDPEDAGAYSRMAFSYYQTAAYYPGIEAYKKAIALDDSNTTLYNMLGYTYLGIARYDDAISTFEQLIDVDPEDPNSYDSMAEAHYLKGDTTTAIRFYQQSLSVDSTFTNPYYMLGEIHYGLDQPETARGYLERYLELAADGFRAQDAQGLLDQLNEEE